MNILWLYKYIPSYNLDHWFHIDFSEAINKFPGISLRVYGPGLKEVYPNLSSFSYNRNTTLKDIREDFNFDVIILNTKSRMFDIYSPSKHPYGKGIEKGQWLPYDIKDYKVPKIMIEEDYHYEVNNNWYVSIGIDLMLQRHYSSYISCKEKNDIKTRWLPFSVDINVFKPDYDINRIKKICLAGSCTFNIYNHRLKVRELLEEYKLIDSYEQRKQEYHYIKCLQSYISHLCGSSVYDITAAKMFEIMSSGSLLFTNESDKYGIQELFPEDCYCTYKETYEDVVEKANKIIKDRQYTEYTTKKALECIREKHTNEIRIRELVNIIKEEFNL